VILPSITRLRNLSGKRIFVRVDFNVPVEKSSRKTVVTNDWRIRKSLPTLEYLLSRGARVVIGSDLGRPQAKKQAELSTKPIATRLGELIKYPIKWSADAAGPNTQSIWEKQKNGTAVFLENLRFYKGENENSDYFAKKLAKLADAYVNDAFAKCHREQASLVAITKHLPSYAGFLLQEEVESLRKVMHAPKRPMVVVLGGAKVATKLGMMRSLMKTADVMLVGGLLFVAYLHSRDYRIGSEIFDDKLLHISDKLMRRRIVQRPVDVIIGKEDGSENQILELRREAHLSLDPNLEVLDIGPETILRFGMMMEKAKTIIWNGAMGKFEQHPYEYGTYAIARQMGAASLRGTFTVAGGGETVQALEDVGVLDKLSHVSTGGGAMGMFLAGGKLPGIEALVRK